MLRRPGPLRRGTLRRRPGRIRQAKVRGGRRTVAGLSSGAGEALVALPVADGGI